MPKALRKNITLSKAALKQAAELKAMAYASTRSGVITRAVNEAWERRTTPAPPPSDDALPIVPFSDKTKRRDPGHQN